MIKKETRDAAEALVRWMQSQDINPEDGIPVLAMAMCIAAISLGDDFNGDVEHINSASRCVAETFLELVEHRE